MANLFLHIVACWHRNVKTRLELLTRMRRGVLLAHGGVR